MKSIWLRFILFTTAILWSCEDEYNPVNRTISLPAFTSVSINSVFTIYLVQDTIYSLRILADNNVVDHIAALVDGTTLNLTNNSPQKWLSPESNKVTLYVHSPAPWQVTALVDYSLYSYNTITSNVAIVNESDVKFSEIDLTLDCASFDYWNNYLCNGRLALRGRSEGFSINNFALHEVYAIDLDAQNGFLNNYSSTDSRVYVTHQLRCNLNGPGDIYVYGNPTEIIVDEHTSSGQVIRMN